MRTCMVIVAMAVVGGCGAPLPVKGKAPERLKIGEPSALTSAEGTVENGTPRDGCSFPVVIAGETFAPSDKSVDRIRAFLGNNTAKVPIALIFKRTGFTANLECGFLTYERHPEIEIEALSAPCAATEKLATTCDECGPAGGCSKSRTGCTPTCNATTACATGVCSDGVCSKVAGCI